VVSKKKLVVAKAIKVKSPQKIDLKPSQKLVIEKGPK